MNRAMDELHRELAELNLKIEQIYTMVEGLSQQIADLLSREESLSRLNCEQSPTLPSATPASQAVDPMMQHKDILSDNSRRDNPLDYEQQKNLSSELQVRRLTAQVTAAYNRIAALEEQLLARRISPAAKTSVE